MTRAALALLMAIAACGRAGEAPPPRPRQDAALAPAVPRLRIAVDPRIELFSILFGFAGARPYGKGEPSPYFDAVAAHFKPFGRHPAVAATAALLRSHGVSFDAPAELAVYLDDDLRPIRPLRPLPPGLDPRWEGVDLDAFLGEVRAFAADTGFAAFFASQAPYFAELEARFAALLDDQPILPWFDAVFGARADARYLVVPAPMVGGNNFGVRAVHLDGTEDVVAVMFLEPPGAGSNAGYLAGELTLELVIHELAHSYINPVFEPHAAALAPVATPAFRQVEAAMAQQSYPTVPIVIDESVVRAVTQLYLRDHGTAAHAARQLDQERQRSFVWIDDLVTAMADQRRRSDGRLSGDALIGIVRDIFTKHGQGPADAGQPH